MPPETPDSSPVFIRPEPQRERMSADQVEQQMLKTAKAMIARSGGLTVSLEHLKFEDVIYEANVPRSAAYRKWKRKEDFYMQLLIELAGPSDRPALSSVNARSIEEVKRIIQENNEMLQSERGRDALYRRIIRVSVDENFRTLWQSSDWRTSVALKATLLSLREGSLRSELERRLREFDTVFLKEMAGFYKDIGDTIGFRLQEPLSRAGEDGYQLLARCGAALMEGFALSLLMRPDQLNATYDFDGVEWTLASVAFLALWRGLTEIDKEYAQCPADSDESAGT